jgi:hypothetical protein
MFDNKKTLKEIAQSLNLTKSTARLLIKRSGRTPILKCYQTQRIVINPFLIKNEISDYWLGWLASDGNIYKNSINFYSGSDLEHLKKIFVFLQKELKIYKNNSCYAIGFSSKEIAKFIIDLGITPKKSRTLKFNIPLTWDIVRGIFDGDGSISLNIPKITTGSYEFVQQLADFLNLHQISYTIGIKDKNKNNCWDIRIKSDGRFLFYYYLYKDATVFLERKKDKYRAALKKFKVKNIGSIAGILPFIQEAISSQAVD